MDGKRLGVSPSDAISRIRFAPRSNNLLISSWDAILRLYDVDAAAARLEVPSEASLLDCCFIDESAAVSAGSDCYIRRYDLASGKHENAGRHDDLVISVEYSKETGQVISTGMDRKMILWDMRGTFRANELFKMNSAVESITLCDYYLVAAIKNSANVYDLRKMTEALPSKGSSMDFHISCVRSFSDKKGYITGSVDGCVALNFFEESSPSETRCNYFCHPKTKERKRHLVGVNDIATHPWSSHLSLLSLPFSLFSYDGVILFSQTTFITGDNEGYAIVWDAHRKKRKFEFPKQSNSVASLSYNHNGRKLAIVSSYINSDADKMQTAPEIFLYEVDDSGIAVQS